MLNRTFRQRSPIILITIAIVAFGHVAKASEAPADSSELARIASLRYEYVSAWKSGNGEDVARLYTNDGIVLYPNNPAVVGQEEIVRYFNRFFDEFDPKNFELTSKEVKIAGDWAFDRGTYRLSITPKKGGEVIEDNGKYLVILQRQADGSWKVSRDMDNSDKPIPK